VVMVDFFVKSGELKKKNGKVVNIKKFKEKW
jgi:hypothetical protein